MDFDDIKRMKDQQDRERFNKFQDAFNAESKRRGDPRTFDDFMGQMDQAQQSAQPKPDEGKEAREKLGELIHELHQETTDEDPKTIVLRALGIYRSIVRHARDGGTVKFVGADGTEKTLKVRLR